jgi:hypothetical protein
MREDTRADVERGRYPDVLTPGEEEVARGA